MDTYIIEALYNALKNLTVRFQLDVKAALEPEPQCQCLQFEDYNYCSHIQALEAVEMYEIEMEIEP